MRSQRQSRAKSNCRACEALGDVVTGGACPTHTTPPAVNDNCSAFLKGEPMNKAESEDDNERREIHFLLLVSRVMRGLADPEDLIDELRECGRTIEELKAEVAATPKPS